MFLYLLIVQAPTPPPAVEYPIDGGRILCINGKIRETACEVLFEQDNEEKSVATLILDAILKVRWRKETRFGIMRRSERQILKSDLIFVKVKHGTIACNVLCMFKFHRYKGRSQT